MFNTNLFSSVKEDWGTPQWLFDELNFEFGFTLDACANEYNAKCNRYFSIRDNGLEQDWSGNVVFCNPPYGKQLSLWVEKCWNESKKPNTIVVMLIPVRTDTKWFHKFVYNQSEIRFLNRRLKFQGSSNMAPFPSMIVIFRGQ